MSRKKEESGEALQVTCQDRVNERERKLGRSSERERKERERLWIQKGILYDFVRSEWRTKNGRVSGAEVVQNEGQLSLVPIFFSTRGWGEWGQVLLLVQAESPVAEHEISSFLLPNDYALMLQQWRRQCGVLMAQRVSLSHIKCVHQSRRNLLSVCACRMNDEEWRKGFLKRRGFECSPKKVFSPRFMIPTGCAMQKKNDDQIKRREWGKGTKCL